MMRLVGRLVSLCTKFTCSLRERVRWMGWEIEGRGVWWGWIRMVDGGWRWAVNDRRGRGMNDGGGERIGRDR